MKIRTRKAPAWAALLLAAGLTAAACSSGSGSGSTNAAGAPTGLSPGAGQNTLAGTPGSEATGSAGTDAGASGSGSSGAGASMPGMTMSVPAATGPVTPVAGNAVEIKNFAFAPAALTVKAGTKVTWTNADTDAHTVTSQNNAGPLNSSALATGQSYSYTFTKPGTYSYFCTIHPFMTATVTVTQ